MYSLASCSHIETSLLGCKTQAFARRFWSLSGERSVQSYLQWHGVYTISSEGQPCSVASDNEPEVPRTYSNPYPHGKAKTQLHVHDLYHSMFTSLLRRREIYTSSSFFKKKENRMLSRTQTWAADPSRHEKTSLTHARGYFELFTQTVTFVDSEMGTGHAPENEWSPSMFTRQQLEYVTQRCVWKFRETPKLFFIS